MSKNKKLYGLNKNRRLPICYDVFNSSNLFFPNCKYRACYNCINSL